MIDKKRNRLKIEAKIKEILENAFETPWFESKIYYSPHFFLKTFLFLFIIVSTGYVSYLTIQSIMAYLEYGVATTTRTYFETPMLFPKVTICNLNPFTTEYAYNLYQNFSDAYQNEVKKLSDKDQKKLGHDLDDILMGCKFNLDQCDYADFTRSFDLSNGNCYTFNADFDSNGTKIDLRKSSIAGPTFGLRLRLYVNYHEKLGDLNFYLGAWIRLGNSSYLTDDYSNEGGTLVSAGFQTNLAINREFKSLQPKPYSNCELDSNSPFIQGLDLYNLISKSGYLYTQQLCFFQCYQKYLLEKNNCTESVFLSLFNAGSCNWEWAYFCDDDFTDEFIDQHCITSCPLECDQISYRTSVSSSQLSTYLLCG
jgi:hypothetical protein